jgi:NSS family neurotransmitter:Na+ symporter
VRDFTSRDVLHRGVCLLPRGLPCGGGADAAEFRVTAGNEAWSGRGAFILAAVGSAVGLGSIWKFPYEAGSNGGAAFVLFYLAGLALVVVPLMLVEFAIGRRGGADAAASIAAVADAHGRSRAWGGIGALGAVTSWLVLSFYAVIGGWTLAYMAQTGLTGLPGSTAAEIQQAFDRLLASPARLVAFQALFLAATCVVVARGIRRGIETASNVLMPALLVLMVVLCGYAIAQGDAPAAARFLFRLDMAHLSMEAALEALGLGFFSIGVGMGVLITYAAYADKHIDLAQAALVTVVADTSISFLAGFTVFPLVFASGLDPAGGPGLVFVTLPLAFAAMPFGRIAALAFFALLFVAALASAISMLEIGVEIVIRRLAWSRPKASIALTLACFVAGIGSVLSFNHWADWHPLSALPPFATATFFDLLDYTTSNVLLPLAGFGLAVFAGWGIRPEVLNAELGLGLRTGAILGFALRYVVPAGILGAALAPLVRG